MNVSTKFYGEETYLTTDYLLGIPGGEDCKDAHFEEIRFENEDEIKEGAADRFINVERGFLPSPNPNETEPSRPSALAAASKIAETLEPAQTSLDWVDVDYKIGSKSILSSCYGSVAANSICGIMGPSGCGKTSLLNILSGRSYMQAPCCGSASSVTTISGTVSINNLRIDPVKFRKHIAYVTQDPALMETATPRESLAFSAALRLPAANRPTACSDCCGCCPCCNNNGGHTNGDVDIDELVANTLHDLQLESCADTPIGGVLIKGISGGEARRVAVGIEIITNPVLLFLDEPTSGLDSFSAASLIRLLKSIARSNASILCAIHQPSSDVFFEFDQVIFLKEGQVIYQGITSDVLRVFGSFGYACAENYNPADFVMNLLQTHSIMDFMAVGIMSRNDAEIVRLHQQHASAAAAPSDSGFETEAWSLLQIEDVVHSTSFKQMRWLVHREFFGMIRNPTALYLRFGIALFMSLLFGLIFFQVGDRDLTDPSNLNALFGALTIVTVSSMFQSAQPVMLALPFERPLFLREYTTGTYYALTYFLSKLCLELPITFLQALIQFTLVYNLCKFQGSFILMVLASWGLGEASGSVAVLLGCLVNNVKAVSELAPLIFVPQLLFSGFFIRTSLIPIYLRWAQYLCALKYALNLILITEFSLSTPACSASCQAMNVCANVLEENDIVREAWWVYALVLFCLFAVFRVVAAVVLVLRAARSF